MTRTFLLVCLIAAANAGSTGYNYNSIEQTVAKPTQHIQQTVNAPQVQDGGIQKQFYYFNVPEEPHVAASAPVQQQIITPPKKNLNVIFIQPPEQKVHRIPAPVQQVTHQNVEQKTHIYVLSKEPTHHHAAPQRTQTIQQSTVHRQKPEIHFLKYKTPSEAQHIQESIIQQYGGKPSEIVQLGSAPVANFASTTTTGKDNYGTPSVSRAYLAPPVFRH